MTTGERDRTDGPFRRLDLDTAALLCGFGLGAATRIRDDLVAGRTEAALRVAREMIELHLRAVVADADDEWIARMVGGSVGAFQGIAGRAKAGPAETLDP